MLRPLSSCSSAKMSSARMFDSFGVGPSAKENERKRWRKVHMDTKLSSSTPRTGDAVEFHHGGNTPRNTHTHTHTLASHVRDSLQISPDSTGGERRRDVACQLRTGTGRVNASLPGNTRNQSGLPRTRAFTRRVVCTGWLVQFCA